MFKMLKNVNVKEVFRALFSKESPIYVKAILIAAIIYVISPLDVLPDFLGLIGWVDDAAVVTGLVTLALKLLDKHKLHQAQSSTVHYSASKERKDVTNSMNED